MNTNQPLSEGPPIPKKEILHDDVPPIVIEPPHHIDPPDNGDNNNGSGEQPSNDDFLQLLATIIMIIVIALTTATLSDFGGDHIPLKEKEEEKQEGATGLLIPTEEDLARIPQDDQPISSNKKKINPLLLRDSSALLYFPPAGDQGKQLSCTAFSVAYAMVSYYEKRRGGYGYDTDVYGNPSQDKVFSPAFVYNWLSRGNCLKGIAFRNAFDLVRTRGVCKWNDCTYDGTRPSCGPEPTTDSKKNAQDFLGYRFYQPEQSFNKFMEYMDAAIPLIIGIYTSKSMYDDGKDANRERPFFWNPSRRDVYQYHAMLCIGFDKEKNSFILLNSWGREWGDNGYCYINKDIFMDRVREVYIARLTREKAIPSTKGITERADTSYFAKSVRDVKKISDNNIASVASAKDDRVLKKKFLNDYAMLDSVKNRSQSQDSLMLDIKERYLKNK